MSVELQSSEMWSTNVTNLSLKLTIRTFPTQQNHNINMAAFFFPHLHDVFVLAETRLPFSRTRSIMNLHKSNLLLFKFHWHVQYHRKTKRQKKNSKRYNRHWTHQKSCEMATGEEVMNKTKAERWLMQLESVAGEWIESWHEGQKTETTSSHRHRVWSIDQTQKFIL